MFDAAERGMSPGRIYGGYNSSVTATAVRRKWNSLPRFVKVYVPILLSASCLVIFFFLVVRSPNNALVEPPIHKESDRQLEDTPSLGVPLKSQDSGSQHVKPPIMVPDILPEKDKKSDDDVKYSVENYVVETSNVDATVLNKDLNHQGPLNDKQKEIVAEMKWSWDAYRKYAWGADHLKPVTKSKHNWFSVGLTILDSVDTLLFMGLEKEYKEALEWIQNDLNFDIYKDVNCFEMTIRSLGGLLSAYHMTKNAIFLNKAIDLGERLIHCFDTPSKVVPYSDVNLKSKTPKAPSWSPESSLSEATSIQMEFRDLSYLTGDKSYEQKSFKTSEHIHNMTLTSEPLLPMYINPITGRLTSSTITLGARGDSYYEYLLKQYLQTGIEWLKYDYIRAMDSVKSRMIKTTQGSLKLTFVGEILQRSSYEERNIHPKMDHLVCFLPGTMVLAYHHFSKERPAYRGMASFAERVDTGHSSDWLNDHLKVAEDIARTCWMMYNLTNTGLSPEIAYFGLERDEEEYQIRPADTHNLLRPEYVESLFYLYHITSKEIYREQGWMIFQSFKKYCRVASGGYTSIGDVRNPSHVKPRDMQESFWLAETLKYLFLLFSDDKVLAEKLISSYIFNTEAHVIPRRV